MNSAAWVALLLLVGGGARAQGWDRNPGPGQSVAAPEPGSSSQEGEASDAGGGDPYGTSAGGQDSGSGGRSGRAQGGSGGGDARPAKMPLGDAKLNIVSIVKAFVSAHSQEGVWPLRDKKTGRVRRLSLEDVDDNTTAAAGEQRFKVMAKLRDVDTGESLRSEFVADFSGPEWRVIAMRLFESKPRRVSASRGR